MSDSSWPELSWDVPAAKQAWFVERVKFVGERTRAFELALELAVQSGEAALSRVSDELSLWEQHAANVWMYAGLGDARQVPAEDLPYHAEELAKVYGSLQEIRREILARLGGPSAAKVIEREATVRINDAQIRERAGELPSFVEFDTLGQALPVIPVIDPYLKPVTMEELKLRQTSEAKLIPESGNLGPLLAILPSEWVGNIFEALALPSPGDDEMTAGSRSVVRRGVIYEHLRREDFLRDVVYSLGDDDQAVLRDLLAAKGAMAYAEVTRRHGKDDADGFFWGDRPPSGPLARLRRLGLCFVATRKGQLTAQLPKDLVKELEALLAPPVAPAAE